MAAGATPGGGLVDGSSTLAAGGVSQQVFAANRGRQYLIVQNQSAGNVWVNFGVAAVEGPPSIKILPDASLQLSSAGTGVVPTATVNIRGATLGQAFTAKES